MPMDPADREALIRTVYGEASGGPALGQAGVTHAILNRVNGEGHGQASGRRSRGDAEPARCSARLPRILAMESARSSGRQPDGARTCRLTTPIRILRNAYADTAASLNKSYNGLIPDPTGGATHYYGYMPRPPKWAGPLAALNTRKIGHQTFVGGAEGPGRQPVIVAGGRS